MRALLIVVFAASGVAACAETVRDDGYGVTYVDTVVSESQS